jgi:hypothetical protein
MDERTEKEKQERKIPTWGELVKIEPRLLALATEASAYKKDSPGKEYVCANDRWYGYGEWKDRGIKARLLYLVGWDAWNPALRSMEAYDLAYSYIYNLLPDCRNCACG